MTWKSERGQLVGKDEITGLNYFDDFIRIAGEIISKKDKTK